MDFMLRFNVWLKVTRGSRKVGGSCPQLWQIAVAIASCGGSCVRQPSAKVGFDQNLESIESTP